MKNQDNNLWEGYQEDPFGNMGQELCEKCKCRAIDRSEDPKSVWCMECREELIRQKKRKVACMAGISALILILVAGAAFSVFFIKSESHDTQDIWAVLGFWKAGQNEESGSSEGGYILTGMGDLLSALVQDPEDLDTAFALVDMAMEHAYYEYASYVINQYIAEKDISDKQYRKVARYENELNLYFDTCNLSNEIVNQVYEDVGEDGDPYEVMEKYCQAMSEYIGNSDYDQALVYYCLGNMTADGKTRINYLKKCVAINPHYYDAQAEIATYCRRQGDLKKARRILTKIYEINKEDYAVLRSYATLELVEGNLEKGLDYASRAYEMNKGGGYVIDTYIVALAANGRTDEARELAKKYEDKDYMFDEELYDFLDGTMTLEDYYIGE